MWVISWMNRVNTTQPPLADNFKAAPLIIATTASVRSVQLYQRSCLVWRQIPQKKMTQVNPPSLAFLLLTTLFICALTFSARPVESAAAVVTHQDHAAALTALLHRTVRSSDDDNSNSVNEGGPCGANCIHRRLYSMCICVTCPENSTICVMKSNTITINMTRP